MPTSDLADRLPAALKAPRIAPWLALAALFVVAVILGGIMTPHPLQIDSACESAELRGEAGAPEVEIEITPKMVEAGALALSSYDDAFESAEEVVIRIFRAMSRSARTPVLVV